uniref:Uncharacterized protein n=1 Tax=Kryptolebias marmoratus TaxID=37003 RepID=A0A3Q3BJW9_KRYMA
MATQNISDGVILLVHVPTICLTSACVSFVISYFQVCSVCFCASGLEKDGEAQEYTEIGDVDFYQTCDDCLLMDYKTSTHQFLLFYKKEGSHQDAEQHKTHHDDHKKLAELSECLGFPDRPPYIYNGKADFCHKKSAPEPSAE